MKETGRLGLPIGDGKFCEYHMCPSRLIRCSLIVMTYATSDTAPVDCRDVGMAVLTVATSGKEMDAKHRHKVSEAADDRLFVHIHESCACVHPNRSTVSAGRNLPPGQRLSRS